MLWVWLSVFNGISALQMRVEQNATPPRKDIRLCRSYKLDTNITYHFRHFTFSVSDPEVHHLALGACLEPGSTDDYWVCDEFRHGGPRTNTACKDHQHMFFLYGEAYGARDLDLPRDHAYEIGKGTPYKYLIFQTHYGQIIPGNQYHSEVTTLYDIKPKSDSKTVTFPLANDDPNNSIPPHQKSIIEAYSECLIPLHPMIYNFHTHELGRSMSLYVVKRRSSDTELDTWVRLGKRDLRLPQLYIPVEHNVTVNAGDGFAVRCTYYNDRDEEVKIGLNNDNEMCLIALSVWYKRDDNNKPFPIDLNMNKSWQDVGLNNIPEDA